MNKRLIILTALIICSFTFSMLTLPEVQASSTTQTFLAPASDGYVYVENANYYDAHDALTGTVDSGGTYQVGGQYFFYEYIYGIFRSITHFDTSALPDDAQITSAILSLYIQTDVSTTDFSITVQSSTNYPHNPIQASDYYYGYYSTEGGSRSTSEIAGTGYWNITLTSTGIGYISKTSDTRLMIRSSNDINSVAPTGDEYVTFASRDSGEAYAAKLYVTYTTGTSTSSSIVTTTITSGSSTYTSTVTSATTYAGSGTYYIVHGPYYEDGEVATDYVNVTIYQPYNSTLSFGLNGTDSVADDYSALLAQPASYMVWNCSSTENYTRVFYFFEDENFEEIWIFVPRTTEPFYPYTFVPADFYGMQNPYLETSINVDGTRRVVERKKADINQLTFCMIQWHHYDLTWHCDQGTYTQGFSAENSFTNSLVVLAGAFPTTTATQPTVTASRLNATAIQVTYTDPSESTVWVSVQIWHYNGATETTDYFLNTTANSLSVLWAEADSETDYYVHVQAYSNGFLYGGWQFSLSWVTLPSNPFSGLLDWLGSYPSGMIAANIIGAVIVMLFLAIGSSKTTGFSCLLAWIICGILVLMGWITLNDPSRGIPMFFLAGFVSVLVFIEERKTETREV